MLVTAGVVALLGKEATLALVLAVGAAKLADTVQVPQQPPTVQQLNDKYKETK